MTDSERCKVGYEMLPLTSSGINLLIADAPVIATRACTGLELYNVQCRVSVIDTFINLILTGKWISNS
jgi:hypothetical protein